MKKYLISLAKDSARRELFFSQPDTVDFQVFNAINTMSVEWQELAQKYDLTKFEQRYQRKATKGEVGCTFSHLGVYQQIINDESIAEQEYCLVCEDDALFNQDFQSTLDNLVRQDLTADIVLIGQSKILSFEDPLLEIEFPTTFKQQMKPIDNTAYRVAYPYRNYYAGTVAYLIQKSSARKFLTTGALPFWLADDFILFEQQWGLDILVVRPLMAIENPVLTSNLEGARASQQQATFKKILKYPLKKLLAIKRNAFN
ncbi:glycosyltransferase family 25 protein [Actinobacillus equuli]|uniref:glycosyltransferase family 25 protein n=1 Tax=Actinobacillus equuli TaxID=718 RepID=UPI00244248CB|nr:glycosyltransferase family 25 protein [Actinobacillus equuli]WGE48940.1 glycosyltransferase family 25 protein [Actinobacillus equuli subsp. equuli]